MNIKKHLVITLEEQYAIVNALAFYHESHTKEMSDDEIEQFRLAFKEDNYGTNFVDQLATKVANINWLMKHRARQTDIVLNENRELIIGKRGGIYYIDENGKRVYLADKKKPTRKYKAPRGAFARYLESQRTLNWTYLVK